MSRVWFINYPVDRDSCLGLSNIIDDVCPQCGRREVKVSIYV